MKLIAALFGFTFVSHSSDAKIKPSDPLIYVHEKLVCDTPPVIETQLAAIDWTQFPGHSINYLLANIPAGYTLSNPMGFCKLNIASGIEIHYSDNVFIRVIVDNFQHFNQYSPRNTWPSNINLFKQEDVYKVEVYDHEGHCMNNCD